MKYLFFFVHPSKFHVFRNTINHLLTDGHQVDILITSKDILEDLVKQEGWQYSNIFPSGRKIKNLPQTVGLIINFFRTIYRLLKYTRGKKYDLFITDDLLVYIGKWKKTPSIVFCDDDLLVVKQFALILAKADYILSPDITNCGKYTSKKIGFPGYKELAYLHPNHFLPEILEIKTFNPELKPYFILRLVSLLAYHDVGKKGISNDQVIKLITLLESYGRVFISAERELPIDLESYRLSINPEKIANVIYYAQMFIGDSQTMTSEAAVLGTPAFRCNDFVGKISVMEEKEYKYGLSFNYRPCMFDEMVLKIESLLKDQRKKDSFQKKRNKMLQDKIDLSLFMIWLFENYPRSIKELKNSSFSFDRFKLKD